MEVEELNLQRKKYYLYLTRFLSACCFYLFLAKANTWLDTTDNTLLAFGYRFFILLAPLFFILMKRRIAFYAFSLSTLGLLCWLFSFLLIGTLLFSAGMALGGYVLKYHASKTPMGAANNRVALNMGVFFSGLIMLLPVSNQVFMIIGIVFMTISLFCSLVSDEKAKSESEFQLQKMNFSFAPLQTTRGVAWAITGLITGVKLMSTMSILPQYLISYYGSLPDWFGIIISVSSLVVVLMQKPVMKFVQGYNLNRAFIPLFISMAIIAVPNAFYCETLVGSLIWTFLLTVLECGVSYLDVFASREGSLLVKEFFVGAGMALAVLLMRNYNAQMTATLLGISGILALMVAVLILRPAKASDEVAIA